MMIHVPNSRPPFSPHVLLAQIVAYRRAWVGRLLAAGAPKRPYFTNRLAPRVDLPIDLL